MTDSAAPGDSERHPGPNAWLLEEMRSQFEHEPDRLDDDSLTFFATGRSNGAAALAATAPVQALPATTTPSTHGAPALAAPVATPTASSARHSSDDRNTS